MHYLIIDVEATCWKKERRQDMEIIQIGGAIVDSEFNIIERFSYFVRPSITTKLSDFCIELTGITDEKLAKEGMKFPDAVKMMKELVEKKTGQKLDSILFCSWGDYDRHQFIKDCARWKIPYPFCETRHFNIKIKVAEYRNWKKSLGVSRAMNILGLKFEGRPHDGGDDAYNIAKIFVSQFSKDGIKL